MNKMSQWKCKECGCTEFIEKYKNGYRKYGEYDENGEPIVDTLEEDDPELEIQCENCGYTALKLKTIANCIEV